MSVYFCLRLVFYFQNYKDFQSSDFLEVMRAFVMGLRFDLATVLLLNLITIVFYVIPMPEKLIKKQSYKVFHVLLLFIVNIPFFILNIIDSEYYKFTGKRATIDIFGLAADATDQAAQLIKNYWGLTLLEIFISVLFIVACVRIVKSSFSSKFKLKEFVFEFPIVVLLCVLGIRGGLQVKPLNVTHAFALPSASLKSLALNSTFTILKTSQKDGLKTQTFFANDSLAKRALQSNTTVLEHPLPHTTNIVLIILESFDREYMGNRCQTPLTPFLNQLAHKGVFFENHFANGRRSIDAIPAILAGIPDLMGEPYVTSKYQNNRIIGVGSVFKKIGYDTLFFHGGKNGTMYFDMFSQLAGFEKYIGLNEYPDKKEDFDGAWGIFDEPFLQFGVKKLSQQNKPFFATFFTLSSHNPYNIPNKYKNKFSKGSLPIHESIGYSDFALKKFFESAEKTNWYKNTLFVLTGDHAAVSACNFTRGDFDRYRVPLIFFHPQYKFPKANRQKVTQHIDIPATLYHLFGIDSNNAPVLSHSAFDSEGFAINREIDTYLYAENEKYIKTDLKNNTKVFERVSEKYSEIHSNLDFIIPKIKAIVQFYNNSMIKNEYFPKDD